MKIDIRILGARLAFGVSVAAGVEQLVPSLTASHAGLLALLLVVFGGAVAFAPSASGIARPVSAESLSVFGKLALLFTSFVNAPKSRRAADLANLQAMATQAGINAGQAAAERIVAEALNKTGQFATGQLGGTVIGAVKEAIVGEAAQAVAVLEKA